MSTSIVIPLGSGSRNNDLELRYCLRSVERYLTGYNDVFIIGRKPTWLQNVIHIPYDEGFAPQSYEKERNIFGKIMAACGDERVSENFLFMNDDHYLLREYEAGTIPYYYDGTIDDKLTVTDYKHTVWNTSALFDDGAIYLDVHCPIMYNKLRFQYSFLDLNWARWGYCIKSVYANKNINAMKPVECSDLKINEVYHADKIKTMLTGRAWFSIGDKAFSGDIAHVLQELYPIPSKYEKVK